MRGVQYLADGHHVDDAGNLISCTYVDFRDPAERSPITALRKAASQRNAIPGCETIRISTPSCFLGQGEGPVVRGAEGDDWSGSAGASTGTEAAPADAGEPTDEACYGRNGWIFCASIEPETPAERIAWREAMPAGYDAVSPIRRPRAFARALGAIAAEQAGPRGRTVLLRNTIDGEAFSTAHRSQTVYHGPVVYSDDPYRRLERASSDLELLLLLLVSLKDAAHRAQREYRFVVWAEEEPREDRLDLPVSLALLEAMQTPPLDPKGGRVVPPGVEESSTVDTVHEDGHPKGHAARRGAAGLRKERQSDRGAAALRRRAPAKRSARDGAGLRDGRGAQSSGRRIGRDAQNGRRRLGVARGADRALPLLDLRRRDRRPACRRGRLRRAHGRTLRRRLRRGEHRGGAGGDLRV